MIVGMGDLWSSLGLKNEPLQEVIAQSDVAMNTINTRYNYLGTVLETAVFTNVSEVEARKFVAFIDTWIAKLEDVLGMLAQTPPDSNGRVSDADSGIWAEWFIEAEKVGDYITEVTQAVKAQSAAAEIAEILRRAMDDFRRASGLDLSWIGYVGAAAILLYAYMKGSR